MRARGFALLVGLAAVAAAAGAAPAATPSLDGTWVGTVRVPASAAPAAISIELRGDRATVALGAGHPARTAVPARRTGTRLRLSLPGRPAPVLLDGRLIGKRVAGTVRMAAQRGTFALRRGRALEARQLGLYRLPGASVLGVLGANGRRWGVDQGTGEIRELFQRSPGVYSIGAGSATREPVSGEARFDDSGVVWRAARAERLDLRQEEVRFQSGGVTLAGTLTLPPGPGPHAAVAMVHGSGATARDTTAFHAAFFAAEGLATLVYDKRGVGQSGGRWPGEAASRANIEIYARDAEAAARFLAAQPEVDRARVGLSGSSQAGWIMPLAASREPSVRFLLLLVSPTITQGENDYYSQLTGQGAALPTRTLDEIEAEVRRTGPSGFDPMPPIRALSIPALWLYGGNDQHVATRMCVERLEPLTREPGRDFTYAVFPGGNHFLLQTEHGLNAEADRSSMFVPGFFERQRAWLRAHGIVAAG